LDPLDNFYGDENYASGQMRVAYLRGNSDSISNLLAGPMLYTREPERSLRFCKASANGNWTNDFHVYTLEWKAGKFTSEYMKVFEFIFIFLPTDEINIKIDEELQCQIKPDKSFASDVKSWTNIKATKAWENGSPLAPFDKNVVISKCVCFIFTKFIVFDLF